MVNETEGKLIGKVTHYFGKIGVAIIKLTDDLEIGDEIRIVGGDTDFSQKIESMEIDRKKIDKGKPGDSVGLKVEEKARDGYKVYKL